MKPVFEILPDNINAGNCDLVCEVSNEGFSYLVRDLETNTFIALAVYHFTNIIPGNHFPIFQKIFEDTSLLSENFMNVNIIYSFPESVLVPFSMYNSKNNAEVLNMIHGDFTENDVIVTDVLLDHKVYNCYRMPSEIIRETGNRFPRGKGLHQYSLLIKNISADGSKLSVIFYPHKIVVTLSKDGKVLLINSFSYKAAEDVSYILLNVCRQFEIESIPLEVSGLIEKDSSLFKEIYKYFDPVTFTPLPAEINFSEEINQYPPHYFSHFFGFDS